MKIYKINIPLYGIIIMLSVAIGASYIYKSLKKEGYNNKNILLYFIMYIIFAFSFGKIYTMLVNPKITFFIEAGLSSYGGLIGTLLASIIFEKILPSEGKIIKYTVLSLPLIYGLSKIACFISGCCYGLPYEGYFSVTYVNYLGISLFPIQITETIIFIIVFILCNKFRYRENIIYDTIIISAIMKFLLDFLRYDHINKNITTNQIFSIVLCVITIMVWICHNFIFNQKKEK